MMFVGKEGGRWRDNYAVGCTGDGAGVACSANACSTSSNVPSSSAPLISFKNPLRPRIVPLH